MGSSMLGLGCSGNRDTRVVSKKALSRAFSEAVVDPDFSTVIRDSRSSPSSREASSSLMEFDKPWWKAVTRASVFYPLSAARVRNSMAKSATGLAPWRMLNSRLAASPPPTGWSKIMSQLINILPNMSIN